MRALKLETSDIGIATKLQVESRYLRVPPVMEDGKVGKMRHMLFKDLSHLFDTVDSGPYL